MTLLVNGENREVGEGATVAALLESLGLGGAPCAVEVNKELVPKSGHDSTTLSDGDTIEIVTLVGGG